jgi:hypothetical protein
VFIALCLFPKSVCHSRCIAKATAIKTESEKALNDDALSDMHSKLAPE